MVLGKIRCLPARRPAYAKSPLGERAGRETVVTSLTQGGPRGMILLSLYGQDRRS